MMETALLDRLIARHLDGSAAPSEQAALDAELRRDPAAARVLVRAARIDAGLRSLHRAAEPASGTGITVRAERQATARSARRAIPRLRGRPGSGPLPWLLAAGLLLALGAWWALRVPSGGPEPFAGQALAGTVAIPGGGSVRLSPGAQAMGEGGTAAPRLLLSAGTAECAVTPRSGGSPFAVSCPHGTVVVQGTRFSVAVSATGSRVEVVEGLVLASAAGVGERLGPGDLALLNAGTPPSPLRAISRLLAGTAAAWNNLEPGLHLQPSGSGPTGRQALRLACGPSRWAGMIWRTAPQDWRSAAGVGLVLRGRGTLQLEVLDNGAAAVRRGRDGCERFLGPELTATPDWRELRVPFSALRRRPDIWPNLPNDGLGLDQVHGLTLISVSTLDLEVERVGLYGTPP